VTLRLQTPTGVKRLIVDPSTTVKKLKDQISVEHKINAKELSFRDGTKVTKLVDNQSYQFKNGDLIIVLSDIPQTEKEKEPTSITLTDKGEIKETVVVEKKVIEDDIDQLLHKEDGWTYIENKKRGYRTPDDYIAPWNIQLHSNWADLKIKHIPFHSWVREKAYRSGSNTQPSLVQDDFKISKSGELHSSKFLQTTVTINRQPYRHVDSVLFESKEVVEPFVEGWRRVGLQRCGYLLGRYVRDENVPLGITAQVSAIYEPPQAPNPTESLLLKDEKSEIVDELLQKLGLTRIGLIWTSLTMEKNQLVNKRDPASPLEAKEMIRMAHLQTRYPNSWAHSRDGVFGSKFVSVVMVPSKDNSVELEAYQMSNQGVALVTDKIIKAVKKDPTQFKVNKSSNEFIYPDILYSDKDEYGNNVVKKADPFLPSSYFIISVRHGFPKAPIQTFRSNSFPVENRQDRVQDWPSLTAALSGKTGPALVAALNDFHLLYFLATQVQFSRELLEKILVVVRQQQVLPSQPPSVDLKPLLEAELRKFAPQAPGAQPAPAQRATQAPTVDPAALQTLVAMGYPEQRAREALFVSGGNVEGAVNYLLSM